MSVEYGHETNHLCDHGKACDEYCEECDPMTKSESKAAKLLGRKGGLSKSERKAESSRQNGKKGGRPRKPSNSSAKPA